MPVHQLYLLLQGTQRNAKHPNYPITVLIAETWQSYSYTSLEIPLGLQEGKDPRFQANRRRDLAKLFLYKPGDTLRTPGG